MKGSKEKFESGTGHGNNCKKSTLSQLHHLLSLEHDIRQTR